jgi:hypothetical protein
MTSLMIGLPPRFAFLLLWRRFLSKPGQLSRQFFCGQWFLRTGDKRWRQS